MSGDSSPGGRGRGLGVEWMGRGRGGAQAGRPAVKARSRCRGTAARAAGGASWVLNGRGGRAQAGRPAVKALERAQISEFPPAK